MLLYVVLVRGMRYSTLNNMQYEGGRLSCIGISGHAILEYLLGSFG